MNTHDIAQICNNGHVANSMSSRYPEDNKDYCDKCGEETIASCPKCRGPIRGGILDLPTLVPFIPPAYCIKCGEAYPWTARAVNIAIEIAQEAENLSEEERELLVTSIPDVMVDNQKTGLAANHFIRLITKAGSTTFDLLYKWSIDFASETAVKLIKEGK